MRCASEKSASQEPHDATVARVKWAQKNSVPDSMNAARWHEMRSASCPENASALFRLLLSVSGPGRRVCSLTK